MSNPDANQRGSGPETPGVAPEFRYQPWAKQETQVIEMTESPWRVRRETRRVAITPYKEGWERPDKQPNTWPAENLLLALQRRMGILSDGALGEQEFGNMGYGADEFSMAGVELSPTQRVELIAAMEQGYREILHLIQLHEGVSQLRSADSEAAAEVGLFGHPRETIIPIDLLDTLARMEATYPGDVPFQHKVAVAFRALDEVASGKTPLERTFAKEPQRGIENMSLGWMWRAVVGWETAKPFWSNSPNGQFREPGRFFGEGKIAKSLDDLDRGEIGRDFTSEEKSKWLDEKGGGIPDIRYFKAIILADPKQADSLDACLVAWELYVLLRRSVYNAIEPTGKVVVKGDEYNRFLEMSPGTELWHVETTESIAALMHLNLRLIEEGIRGRERWSGPRGLLGVIPNGSAPVDMMMMITRNTKPEGEEASLPEETQRLPLSKFLFEATVEEEEGNRRPTNFGDLNWSHLFLEDREAELFEQVMGVTDSQGRPRAWDRPVMPRKDIELFQRLAQMYYYTLFMNKILKPEKGYADLMEAMTSSEWQINNAKPADTALLLLGIAFGLTIDEARRETDLTMANVFGAIVYEVFGPRKAVADDAFTLRNETRKLPRGKKADRSGLYPEKDLDGKVMSIFWAALGAGIFPQRDLEDTPEKNAENERRLVNILRVMFFVAKNGLGVLPGDVPEWWSSDPSKGGEIARKVSDSGFYRPYHLFSRPKTVGEPLAELGLRGLPEHLGRRDWIQKGFKANSS